jgi:peptide/nickel transport system substrate-binding protein
MTHKDPVLREVFQDKRFRIAVSHGLDRQAVADTVFRGLVKPTQMAPPEGTEWYHEGLANAYLEYDVAKANRLLDEMGLDRRDSDGFRLRSDGKTLEFALHAHSIRWPDAHEMIVDNLRDLGLKVHMDVPENAGQIRDLNDGDAFLSRGMRANAGMAWHLGSAGPWVPQGRNENQSYPAMWAGEWSKWLASGGATGEEPPQLMKDIVSWYEQIAVEPDPVRRKELSDMIFQTAMENLWVPGTVEAMGETVVANGKLGNVPRMRFFFRNGTEPEQIFFRE